MKHNYHDDLIERLRDPEGAVEYLQACLDISKEDKDAEEFKLMAFRHALNNVAEAYGIISPREE